MSVTDIQHGDIIRRDEVGEFLDYVDGLKTDAEDEDYTQEERDSAKAELDEYDPELIEQLRTMYDDTSRTEDDFIAESYFNEHAKQEATELYLYGQSEVIIECFDFEKYADLIAPEYDEWDYDGRTYYART